MTQELAVQEKPQVAEMSLSPMMRSAVSVSEIRARKAAVQDLFKTVFVKDVHFGVIPGTENPTLLQPGGQDIMAMFNLRPRFTAEKTWDGAHLTREVKCVLVHFPTGMEIGEGDAMASTKEKKHRWRTADRKCPKCEKPSIFNSKHEPGFYCWVKKGGCGLTFGPDDKSITEQKLGVIENQDIADVYNTVTKMGDKRAMIAAVLNATGASDTFTQDIEDFVDDYAAAKVTQATVKDAQAREPVSGATLPVTGASPAPTPTRPVLADEIPKGDGHNAFITGDMMTALRDTLKRYDVPVASLGTLIHNTTGTKPKSSNAITRSQYNVLMGQFGKLAKGENDFSSVDLRFVSP